jgi:UDP-N-acetylmuramyl pentapeptide synthase/acylphosphatase/poly-gamma-glutamate capsule biosynthesis protein CapA/YwtB (metallophosphatase superfamily)
MAEADKDESMNPPEYHITLPFLREVADASWCACTHEEVFANGLDYALSTIRKGSILIVVDSVFWHPERIARSGQQGLSDSEIFEFARARDLAGFITSRDFDGHDLPVIRVANSKRFFLDVARANREEFSGKIVAVTGTAGKSSTVSILTHILRSLGLSILSPVGNQNTLYGVAANLTALSKDIDIAVLEVAVSGFARGFKRHVGELIRPHIAVITQIDQGQTDLVTTEQDTARFKGMLIESLRPEGVAIYNADTKQTEYLHAISTEHAGEVVTYGETSNQFRLAQFQVNNLKGEVLAAIHGKTSKYVIPLPSRGMAYNTLAALAATDALGLLDEAAFPFLASISRAPHLLEISDLEILDRRVRLIDDTKNAEIPSVKEALDVLASVGLKGGRRVIVIGHIVNLGEQSESIHRGLAEPVLNAKPDLVFGYGDQIKPLMDRIPSSLRGGLTSDPEEMASMVLSAIRDSDTVLVKGSARNTRLREVPYIILQAAKPLSRQKTEKAPCVGNKPTRANVRIFAYGKVQKVGFRKWLTSLAQARGIDGWVRNRSDGSVEALLRGDPQDLNEVIRQWHVGPPRAAVSKVIVERGSNNVKSGFRHRKTAEVERQDQRSFTLTLCGDTSLGDSYLNARGTGSSAYQRLLKNPSSFFEQARSLISDTDCLLVNLETSLVTGLQSPFENAKPYIVWDDPERTLAILKEIGVQAVNLANNHTKDFGKLGLLQTITRLKKSGFSVFGAGKSLREASRPFKWRIRCNGEALSVFVVGAYEIRRHYREQFDYYAKADSPGVNPLSYQRVSDRIRRLRAANPDALIIACPHWYRNYRWVGDKQNAISSALISAGADLVIGHGAHMLGQCHWSDGGTQVLSLGNFVFNSPGRYAAFSAPPYSLVARLELTAENDGWSSELRLYPIVTDNRRTKFRVQPVDQPLLTEVYSLLSEKAPDSGSFRSNFKPAEDDYGQHIKLIRPLSPRFPSGSANRSRALGLRGLSQN